VFITFAPDGPFMSLECGPYMVGDTVKEQRPDTVSLQVDHLTAGDIVKLISDRGVEGEWKVESGGKGSYEAPAEGRTFYRAEVWRYFDIVDMTLMAGLTNPIYFRC
jgi:hypothetical protein